MWHGARVWVIVAGVILLILIVGIALSTPAAPVAARSGQEGVAFYPRPRRTPTPTPRRTPTPRPTKTALPTPTAVPPTAAPTMAPTATARSTQTPGAGAGADTGGVSSAGDSWLTSLWWGLSAGVVAVLALGGFLLYLARRTHPRP